jgi:hypothetical protein
MRWRQVMVLYAVAAALAGDYLLQSPREKTAERPTVRARTRVLGLDLASVGEITIDHGGRRFVARRAGDGWEVDEPAGANVPSGLVQAFVVAVVDAEAIERQEAMADLTQFGLDEGATRIEVRPSGGPPETLWLGTTNPSGTAVYARRLGTPGVLLVGRTLRYYEELIVQALPQPVVPTDPRQGPVARSWPLTPSGHAG